MKLLMDEGEIIREYNAAADPRKQIAILADQNCTTSKMMAQWLHDHGQKVDKRLMAAGPKKPQEAETKIVVEEVVEQSEPDQTAKADAGKPRLSLVPMQIMFDVAQIREYGNKKYPEGGPDNWKRVDPDRYVDALLRHTLRYVQDRSGVDDESGLPHLWHMATNIAFLCEMEKERFNDIRRN